MTKHLATLALFAVLSSLSPLGALNASGREKADVKNSSPLEKAADFLELPEWANSYVTLRPAELLKTEYFQKVLSGGKSVKLNGFKSLDGILQGNYGVGVNDLERVTFFVGGTRGEVRFVLAMKTTKPVDKDGFVKNGEFNREGRHKGKTYYEFDQFFFSYCVHFVDKYTVVLFSRDHAADILDAGNYTDPNNPLRGAMKLARQKTYPFAAAWTREFIMLFDVPRQFQDVTGLMTTSLTLRVDRGLHLDVVAELEKVERAKQKTLTTGIDYYCSHFLKRNPAFKAQCPQTFEFFEKFEGALRKGTVRQEGRFQHLPLRLEFNPEFVAKYLNEIFR